MPGFTAHIFKGIAALIIAVALTSPTSAQDSTCIATGDVNRSGSVTIGDATALLDFFFISGAGFICPYEADVNGDCVVDRSDLIAILDCLNPPWHPDCFSTETCCNPVLKPCCLGDPNRSGGEPTIADISAMIDAKFITGDCNSICISGADLNGSGGDSPTCNDITITDISILIDCLFLNDDCSSRFGICP
jgi:hypothetical protein